LSASSFKKFEDQEKHGYVIVHAFKTLSLRGQKYIQASAEDKATLHAQKIAKALFDKEVRTLFTSKKMLYSKQRISNSVYFVEDFDLAEETRQLVLKNGGQVVLFKVDSQPQRIK
jgi:hypothetical protein